MPGRNRKTYNVHRTHTTFNPLAPPQQLTPWSRVLLEKLTGFAVKIGRAHV
jgi:hypothetical protein